MSLIGELTKIIRAGEKQYRNAKSGRLILWEEVNRQNGSTDNFICHGENKELMKTLLEQYGMEGKIQMIYIDPPFFSKADYDAVVKAGGENIRHRAYGDRWENGMPAYLRMLASRLYLMRDLLSDTGLIWLHLDWHVVHYARILMDEIFGEKNFVNEIVWNYKSGGTSKRHFARKHDTILVYAKNRNYRFYPLKEKSYNRAFKPYRFKGVKEYRDETGWYTMVNMKDVWNIDMVGRTSGERTGYATQKPEQLLIRMIESCTQEGDLCADFFCGSGTLPAVAAKMGRRFIGCDQGSLAVEHTISRLIRQEESFSVYKLHTAQKSNLKVQLAMSGEEIPGSDKRLLRLQLKSLKGRGLEREAAEKSRETVRKVLKEDPLQMVESWSVDFDFDPSDAVHRPQVIFVRNKGKLDTICEHITEPGKELCVKIVDVFGNCVFERLKYEGENESRAD